MTDFTMKKGADGVAIVTWDVPGKSMNVLSMDGAAELDALIDEALAMNPSGVLREAREHYNACGSGALAAAISCSTACGADAATLLHYTTSHDSGPEQVRDPSMFVGYASMVFARG